MPGEVVLLSYSPGKLMRNLEKKFGQERMRNVRASRVDYYTQHDIGNLIFNYILLKNIIQ